MSTTTTTTDRQKMLQRKYSQKWREANREKYNQLQNQYYHESARSPELLEKMRQYSREYRRNNLEKARTRAREYRDKQRQTRIAAGTYIPQGRPVGHVPSNKGLKAQNLRPSSRLLLCGPLFW